MTRRAPRGPARSRVLINPTPEELEAIDGAAARAGVSRSQFIVGAAIDAAQTGKPRGLTPAQSDALKALLGAFT